MFHDKCLISWYIKGALTTIDSDKIQVMILNNQIPAMARYRCCLHKPQKLPKHHLTFYSAKWKFHANHQFSPLFVLRKFTENVERSIQSISKSNDPFPLAFLTIKPGGRTT